MTAEAVVLSLAAGTALDAGPLGLVESAAEARFGAVGLRIDPAEATPALVGEIRRRLEDGGVRLLDLEVARLWPEGGDEEGERLVGLAAELGAAHVLVVSHDEAERTVARFRRLCERAGDAGVRVALEFMAFTWVVTLDDALAIVAAADHPAGCVLVDTLHLERTGGTAADLARAPIGRMPYLQIADAARAGREDDPDRCMAEARGTRLMPGEGVLPLVEVVQAYLARSDAGAISVEVQSTALAASHSPAERARMALEAARRMIDQARAGRRAGS